MLAFLLAFLRPALLRATKTVTGGPGSFSSLTVSGNLTVVGQGLFADGTQSLPGIAYSADTSLGFWRSGSGEITFVSGGSQVIAMEPAAGLRMRSDRAIGFASGTSPATDAADVVMARDAAGIASIRTITATAPYADMRLRTLSGAALNMGTRFIAGSYTVQGSDFTILASTATFTVNVLLPAAPVGGQVVNVKKYSTDANRLIIDGNGFTIDGLPTTSTIAQTRPSFQLQFASNVADVGSIWNII